MVRAVLPFPVVPGKTEADIRRIPERLKSDPEGYRESRRRGGVTMERAFWQHTPMGDFVVVYFESSGPLAEVLGAPAQSDLDIDRFFVEAVKEIHGVDLTQVPAGPPPELTASRRALGECGEVVSLTATPQGDVISVYLEGADPKDANVRFAASTSPFDVWFKEQCARIFPPFVDFSQPVQGITEIFDSEALLARA